MTNPQSPQSCEHAPLADVLDGLQRTLREERDAIKKLVEDEDADCLSRDLRAERVRTLEYVIDVIEKAKEWPW